MAQPGAVTAAVIGAGHRGALPTADRRSRIRSGCASSPSPSRTRRAARRWRASTGSAPSARFDDWRELLARPRLADVAIVATSDTLHVAPALAALARGYHVLLEKPIAPEPADCERVVEAAESGRPHAPDRTRAALHGVLRAGARDRRERPARPRLADRARRSTWAPGTWRTPSCAVASATARSRRRSCSRRAATTSICWSGSRRRGPRAWPPSAVSRATRRRARREGAPERCTQGCPVQASCAHDAVRFYLGPDEALAAVWPWSDVSPDPSRRGAPPRPRDGPLRALRLPLRQRRARSPAGRGRVRGWPDGVASACMATPCTRAACCASPAKRASCAACSSAASSSCSATARSQSEREQLAGSPLGHFGGDVGLVAHFVDARAARRAAGGARLGARGARGPPARLRRRAGPRAGTRGRVRRLSPRDRGGGERVSERGRRPRGARAAGARAPSPASRSPAAASSAREAATRAAPADAIALVNGQPLSRESFARFTAAIAAERRSTTLDAAERRRLLERMIDEELLLQRGIALGLDRYEPTARSSIVSALIASVTADAEIGEPDEATLRDVLRREPGSLRQRPAAAGGRRVRRGGGAAGGARARARRDAGQAAARGRGLRGRARRARRRQRRGAARRERSISTRCATIWGRRPRARRRSWRWARSPDRCAAARATSCWCCASGSPSSRSPSKTLREQVRAEYLRSRGETALRDYLAGLRRAPRSASWIRSSPRHERGAAAPARAAAAGGRRARRRRARALHLDLELGPRDGRIGAGAGARALGRPATRAAGARGGAAGGPRPAPGSGARHRRRICWSTSG